MTSYRSLCLVTFVGVTTLALLPAAHGQPPPLIPPEDFVTRIDPRPPEEVFANGFSTSGRQVSVMAHVLAGSCDAETETDRSAWISLTSDDNRALEFARQQLSTRAIPQAALNGGSGLWSYTVATDSSYQYVSNIWTTAIRHGNNFQLGYMPWQAEVLQQLALNSHIFRDAEVLTHRVLPENIHSARLLTYEPRLGAVNFTRQPILNPGFREPATDMSDAIENLQMLIPAVNIAYTPPAQNETCMLACDGASADKRPRPERSTGVVGGLNCQAKPSPGRLLISSED